MRTRAETRPGTPDALALKVGDRCIVTFLEDRHIRRGRATVSFFKDSEPYEGRIVADARDSWLVLTIGTKISVPKSWVTAVRRPGRNS
jgi:hypothetical protein